MRTVLSTVAVVLLLAGSGLRPHEDAGLRTRGRECSRRPKTHDFTGPKTPYPVVGTNPVGANPVVGAKGDEEALAIVRNAIKAHGGEANLAKHMTCMVESEGSVVLLTIPIPGVEHTFKSELTAKPGKFKESIRYFQTINRRSQPYMSIHTVYNGEGQFIRDGRSEFLKDQALNEFRAYAHQRELRLLIPLLKDSKYKLTVLDKAAMVSGGAAVALMVHHEDHQDIVLYFDKASDRLVKTKRNFYHFGNEQEGE